MTFTAPRDTRFADELGDTRYLADRTFRGSLAPGETVTGAEFEACTFATTDFVKARLVRCTFADCTFTGSDLSMVELTDSRLVGGAFTGCKMLAISFGALGVSPLADPIRFEDCRLDMSSFQGVELPDAAFVRCSLREVDFVEAVLRGADFAGSDLAAATFGRTDLRDASLRGATGYLFDIKDNRVKGLQVDLHEAAGLLEFFGLDVH